MRELKAESESVMLAQVWVIESRKKVGKSIAATIVFSSKVSQTGRNQV